MRVVASLPAYPPSSLVGSFLSTHECLRHLVRQGHTVHAITTAGDRSYDHEGVHVCAQRADVDALVRRADVVIAHLGDRGRASSCARRHGRPLVRMVHGAEPNSVLKLARYNPDLVVFSSEAIRAETGWSGRSIVVHPPVDLLEHCTMPGDRVTLVNLAKAKGGELFWELAERMPDRQFLAVMGGYGDQVWGDLPNVRVIAPTRWMATHVWSQTRLLLVPSERETWGRVGLEAMISGIPVIAHPCSGLRESLGAGALWADRDDVDRWADWITFLDDRSLYADAADMAHRWAEKFDHQAELAKFTTAIRDLVPAEAVPA